MPNYISTYDPGLYPYNIEVPFDVWMRGEESYNKGLVYTSKPDRFDIFGFILKEAGYTTRNLIGIRIPSQLAQKEHRSGHLMHRCASWLTTPGHSDTDLCLQIGKINDNTVISDDERQRQISNVLKSVGIGVTFTEKSTLSVNFEDAIELFLKVKSCKTPAQMIETMKIGKILAKNKCYVKYLSLSMHTKYLYAIVQDGDVVFAEIADNSTVISKLMEGMGQGFVSNSPTFFKNPENKPYFSAEINDILATIGY